MQLLITIPGIAEAHWIIFKVIFRISLQSRMHSLACSSSVNSLLYLNTGIANYWLIIMSISEFYNLKVQCLHISPVLKLKYYFILLQWIREKMPFQEKDKCPEACT